jgi:hypothetical protein
MEPLAFALCKRFAVNRSTQGVAKESKSQYIEGPTETWHWQKIKNKDYKRQEKIEFKQR